MFQKLCISHFCIKQLNSNYLHIKYYMDLQKLLSSYMYGKTYCIFWCQNCKIVYDTELKECTS